MSNSNYFRKNKPVSFNLRDPIDIKLLEHCAKHSNFSNYIKRLIQRDMDNIRGIHVVLK